MKTILFDSLGGASGDMVLAALIDAGSEAELIQEQLDTLAVEPLQLEAVPASDRGISGTRVTIRPCTEEVSPHRTLKAIRDIVEGSRLEPAVIEQCMAVFQRLAEAEAAIHDKPVDSIHFHEIGALDSIADIVGSCVALAQCKVDHVAVNPLPLGTGTVECAHGTYPVPAPATAALLKGFKVSPTEEPFELVTPTGAALLSTWKSADSVPPNSEITGVGYGIGHRTLNDRPNILRALLFESDPSSSRDDLCWHLECELDDCTPEQVGVLMNRLLEHGALDANITSIHMKKDRPGFRLSVLCRINEKTDMLDLMFRESTTFGIREQLIQRHTLERRIECISTPWGEVSVKIGTWNSSDVTFSPEMESCRRLAGEKSLPVRKVYEAAKAAAYQRFTED